MIPKELGKQYLVVFCKGCGAGFRVREKPIAEEQDSLPSAAETHRCPGCGHTAVYEAREMKVARYQKEGLGRHKKMQ
ncbi:MAG: hypothetical protein JNM59_12610 [Hyphomonadaceae bacterium]|nr:hypothetical protein [Hyphomonadaceae bacterium]